MTMSLRTETPAYVEPNSTAAVVLHGTHGTERYALPLVWEERPMKPREVLIRIEPQPVTLWMADQPAAFRGFGINE